MSSWAPTRRHFHVSVSALVLAAATPVLATAAHASQTAETVIHVDIEAQSLAGALREYARQSGIEVIAAPNLIRGYRAPSVTGRYTVEVALGMLIEGAPLEARFEGGTVVIVEEDEPDAARTEAAGEEDTIVVYGQALSQQRAIEAKRASRTIIDAVSQDDIGRLPDLNTAQALVRVPGVAVQNDQGEARFPVVRGLNATYNRTTIDGGIIASPERGNLGRAVPLDLIPASLVSRLEVQKSISPNLDHNAIGGTVNLVTRSALDSDEPFFVGAAYLGNYEQSGEGTTLDGEDKKTTWRANFATGRTFGPEDTFGVVLGVDYSIRNFYIPQIEVDDADYTSFDEAGNNVGIGNGNGIAVATNNRQFFYNNVRERMGILGKVEWQPSETFSSEVAVSYNEYNDDERRDELRYELGTGSGSNQPAVIREQTATTGITDTGFGIVGIGRFTLDREIFNIRGAVDWDLAPDWNLKLQAVHTTAELSNPEVTESFQTDSTFGAKFDISTFYPRTTPLDPENYLDPDSFAFQSRGTLDRFAEDEIQEYKADLQWAMPSIDALTLDAGVLFRTSSKEEGYTYNSYAADFDYTLALVADDGIDGVDFQGGYRVPFRIGLEESDELFNSRSFTKTYTAVSGTEASEDILASYLMGTYEEGPWTIVGGFRVEQTDFEGTPLGGQTISGDYTDVLPSVNIRYSLTDDIVLRAAASRTLGRPDLNQLTRGFSVNLDDNTVSRSNPDLEPRRATGLDVSAEWYIPNGILSAGVFYKDIENEIFVLTTNEEVEIDGVVYSGVTQPENAESTEIWGFETQYQQTFGFLPAPYNGLGVSANLTLLDTAFKVPTSDGGTRTTGFYQQPDLTYNLTAFYATDIFEVRASYNYTDGFIDTITPDNPVTDEYWDSRDQLDAQARFNLSENMTLIGEVKNITDTGRRELTGPGHNYLQEDARFGRTVWLGLSADF